jgi:excinuclease UvrABC ATPase subunit
VRIDGEIKDLVPKMQVDRYVIHDIELVVDRLQVTDELKPRLSQSVQQTLKLGKDLMVCSGRPPNYVPSLREPPKEGFGESSNSKKSFISRLFENPSFGGWGGFVILNN